MQKLERVLTNLPVRVRFAGFESDTRTLQAHGWELSLERDFSRLDVHLCLKFKDSSCIFLAKATVPEILIYEIVNGNSERAYEALEFNVSIFSTGMQIVVPFSRMPVFSAWDNSSPEIQPIGNEIVDIRKIAPFRTFDNSKELVVDPNDVNAMMDIIMNAQKPGQQRIIRKERMDDMIEMNKITKKKIHLQLVS